MCRPRQALYSAPFNEDWDNSTLDLLDEAVAATGLRPLVLLPNDIQIEEYEHRWEVKFGAEACRALEALGEPGACARLVLCDFAPSVSSGDSGLLPALNAVLAEGWPKDSALVVCIPQTVPSCSCSCSAGDPHFWSLTGIPAFAADDPQIVQIDECGLSFPRRPETPERCH